MASRSVQEHEEMIKAYRAEQAQFHTPADDEEMESRSDDDELDPTVVATFDNSAAASDAVTITVLHRDHAMQLTPTASPCHAGQM